MGVNNPKFKQACQIAKQYACRVLGWRDDADNLIIALQSSREHRKKVQKSFEQSGWVVQQEPAHENRDILLVSLYSIDACFDHLANLESPFEMKPRKGAFGLLNLFFFTLITIGLYLIAIRGAGHGELFFVLIPSILLAIVSIPDTVRVRTDPKSIGRSILFLKDWDLPYNQIGRLKLSREDNNMSLDFYTKQDKKARSLILDFFDSRDLKRFIQTIVHHCPKAKLDHGIRSFLR